MILPFLKGIPRWIEAPATYLLLLTNLFAFSVAQLDRKNETTYEQMSEMISTQGYVYAQYILKHPDQYDEIMTEQAQLALESHPKALEYLGGNLSFQDALFITAAVGGTEQWHGDQVAIERWQERLINYEKDRRNQFALAFGLSYFSQGWQPWLTYQFSHTGLMHLLINMIFLIIFGGFLEPIIGGTRLLITYMLSGVGAALVFVLLNGVTALPLIGASGSIGGMVGVTLLLRGKERLPFFFFLGFVRFPVWIWCLYFWLLSDLTGLLKTMPLGSTNVAHAAHIGGTLTGCLLALLWFLFDRSKATADRVFNHNSLMHKLL